MKTKEETLKEIDFFIEASRYEQDDLYRKFKDKINWENDGIGYLITIGYMKSGRSRNKLPVSIQISFATIGKKRVCFYEASSRAVDWDMIENYIDKNYPVYYDKNRIARENASNFHNCYHFCNE